MTPSPPPKSDAPQGEANTVDEISAVTQVPAAPPAPLEPAPPAPTPTPAPVLDTGAITLQQFVAEAPARSVLAAAMVARNPQVADQGHTEADWQAALDAEAQTPTGPVVEVPATPTAG